MKIKVACPRCGQDYVLRVQLVALRTEAILCPECDALWLREGDVGPPGPGSYGVTWFDYETFMKESGHPVTRFEVDLKVLEPLTR